MALHEAVWVFKYILVHVYMYIGMPIKLFFFLYESQGEGGGGGESKQILREYGFKKTSKITDDPLAIILPCFSTSKGHD